MTKRHTKRNTIRHEVRTKAHAQQHRMDVTWNPDHGDGEHLEGIVLLDLCCQAILHDVPSAQVFRLLGVRVSPR